MMNHIPYSSKTITLKIEKDSILHKYARGDKMTKEELEKAKFIFKQQATHELYRQCNIKDERVDIWDLDDYYESIREEDRKGNIELMVEFHTKRIPSCIKIRGVLRLYNNFYWEDRDVLKDIIKASSFKDVVKRYLDDELKKYCIINNLDSNNYNSSGGMFIASYIGGEIYGDPDAYESGKNILYETYYYHKDLEEDKESGVDDYHTFYL